MPQRYTIFRRAEIYNGQKEDFRKDRRLLHFCNYRRKILPIFVLGTILDVGRRAGGSLAFDTLGWIIRSLLLRRY